MDDRDRAAGMAGASVIAAMITGLLSIILLIVTFVAGNWVAGAIALVAASIAFTGVANAVFRH